MRQSKDNSSVIIQDNNQATEEATTQPNIITIIDEFLEYGGVSAPVESIGFLLAEFITNCNDVEWSKTFVSNTVFESTRIITFLSKIRDARERIADQWKGGMSI